MAIAIPTFLNLTGSAKTNAAESDLTTASQDETVYLSSNGTFDTASTIPATATTDNVAAMTAADPGINWIANVPGTAGTKSVAVTVTSNASPLVAYLETAGSNGTWYWVKDSAGSLLRSDLGHRQRLPVRPFDHRHLRDVMEGAHHDAFELTARLCP